MRRRQRLLIIILLVLPFSLGVERPPGLGDVTEIRHWSYPEYTRVVVELTRPVEVDLHRLPPDPDNQRPERIYVDIPGIWVGRQYADPIPVQDGLLQGVRVGQNTLTKTRVVIDLERYERHRLFQLAEPDRVVIDLYGPRPGSETKRYEGKEPPGTKPRLPVAMRHIETIVLDAGHGGRDPGALGAGKVREKDITLKLVHLVSEKLIERGFKVALTREDDRYLSLEDRTAIAQGAGGDLFISIHANAAERKAVKGIETYYLDESAEWQSVRVAARENGIDPKKMNALQRTIAQLRISEVSVHSSYLAQDVHHSIIRGLKKKQPGKIEDLGVKKGPFYVLFLSSMPSILVEVGFVTNKKEASLLTDPKYLEQMSSEIADGVVRYRERFASMTAQGG